MFRTATDALVFCALALAQAPSPTFEVATIKPAAPQGPGRFMIGMSGGPGTRDPGQMTFSNVNLSMLVANAFDVRDYQVNAPAWMDSERFDIVAKVPQGATRDDVRKMILNLLTERFKMKIHKESKEAAIYALIVGKNGPKLKESSKEEAPPTDGDAPGGGRGPIGPPQRDKNGFPVLRGGRGNLIFMGPNGRLQMTSGHATMAMLAATLSGQIGRPVVDQTGLAGEYDYQLEFTREGLAMPKGMPMMGPPPGGDGGRGPAPTGDGGEAGPSIFTAVQEQLGLRLESRKGPVELIVVDSAEKTPTEN
jgi:uncharacterized protein (TIGR03435 family)